MLVATMGDDDLEVLHSVLGREPAYVGVIASRKRFGELRADLAARRRGRARASFLSGLYSKHGEGR